MQCSRTGQDCTLLERDDKTVSLKVSVPYSQSGANSLPLPTRFTVLIKQCWFLWLIVISLSLCHPVTADQYRLWNRRYSKLGFWCFAEREISLKPKIWILRFRNISLLNQVSFNESHTTLVRSNDSKHARKILIIIFKCPLVTLFSAFLSPFVFTISYPRFPSIKVFQNETN